MACRAARPWDQRWWRDAGAEEIAQAWQVCAEWAAADDPYARATLDELRRQVSRRYGVAFPPESTGVGELAMLLAAPAADAGPDLEFAELNADAGPRFGYTIRAADGRELAGGELAAAGAADAALEALGRYARSTPDPGQDQAAQVDRLLARGLGEEIPGPDLTGVVVEVSDAEGVQPLSMAADRADQVRGELRRQRQDVIGGDREASEPDRLTAVAAEIRAGRLEAAELRRDLDRAYRAEALGGESEAAALTSRLRAVNRRLGDLSLRRRVLEADVRGEDGAAIRRSAVLRENLDEQWWQTATIGEITGVVNEVSTWGPGPGRDEAQRWLRARIHAVHDVDVRDVSDAGIVAGALAAASGQADPEGPELLPRTASWPGLEAGADAASVAQDERAAAALAASPDREAAEAIAVVAKGFRGTPTDRLASAVGRRRARPNSRGRPARDAATSTAAGRSGPSTASLAQGSPRCWLRLRSEVRPEPVRPVWAGLTSERAAAARPGAGLRHPPMS